MQLDNPHSAVVFGGLIGTTSGVAAGLENILSWCPMEH
nr:hypothetical protein [Okeania hirsuta]